MHSPDSTLTSFKLAAAPARLLAITAIALGVGLGGCKSAPPPPDDNALNSALQTKLTGDAAISAEPIQTFVQGSVATLQGSVSSEAARALAASDASQVPGIKSVVNQLSVVYGQSAQSTPPPSASAVATPTTPIPTRSSKPAASVAQPRERISPTYNPPPAPIERRGNENSPANPLSGSNNIPPPVEHRLPPAPAFRNVTVPSGTTLPVRMTQTLDSATTQQGDAFSGSVASDVVVDGIVAIPAGTTVSGRVDEVHEAARFKGASLLTISLSSINRHGERTTIATDPYSQQGKGRGTNTAEKVGGGAAVGAILGGIFGGGKGAAIGAAAGGGLGAGAQAVTRGQQVQIPSESLIRFRLTNSIDVRASTAGANAEGDPTLSHRPNH